MSDPTISTTSSRRCCRAIGAVPSKVHPPILPQKDQLYTFRMVARRWRHGIDAKIRLGKFVVRLGEERAKVLDISQALLPN